MVEYSFVGAFIDPIDTILDCAPLIFNHGVDNANRVQIKRNCLSYALEGLKEFFRVGIDVTPKETRHVLWSFLGSKLKMVAPNRNTLKSKLRLFADIKPMSSGQIRPDLCVKGGLKSAPKWKQSLGDSPVFIYVVRQQEGVRNDCLFQGANSECKNMVEPLASILKKAKSAGKICIIKVGPQSRGWTELQNPFLDSTDSSTYPTVRSIHCRPEMCVRIMVNLAMELFALKTLNIKEIPVKDGRTRQTSKPEMNLFISPLDMTPTHFSNQFPLSDLTHEDIDTTWKKMSLDLDNINFRRTWLVTPTHPSNTFRAMNGYLKKKGHFSLLNLQTKARYIVLYKREATQNRLILAEIETEIDPLGGKTVQPAEKHHYSTVGIREREELASLKNSKKGKYVSMKLGKIKYITSEEVLRISRSFPKSNQVADVDVQSMDSKYMYASAI